MFVKRVLPLTLALFIALSSIPTETLAATVVVHDKKKRQTTVVTLPAKHSTIRYRGVKYHHSRGTFYRRGPSGYVVIAPPVGLTITFLPVGYTTKSIAGGHYYYYQGIYYQNAPDGYMIVEKPAQSFKIKTLDKASIGDKVTVKVERLNIRSGPGKDQPVLRILGHGSRMKILEVGSNWYYVELSDKKTGWVMIRHTQNVETPGQG
jgi:Family of unknown function (DUF6515)/Bacterial SH3 domain